MTEPTAEEITFATLRRWAKQTIAVTAEADRRSAAGGAWVAAQDVLAILDMHGAPPDAPVHFGGHLD